MARYPDAIQHPSSIHHDDRPLTKGIVIHWTAGHKTGDLATLDGPNVDVHFYVDKAGEVYQLLDSDSEAWHAFHTANTFCIGIEHEGSGEPWTAAQLAASAKLARWLCDQYGIPVKHAFPPSSWYGIYGHADLHGIDGNDHTDTVPAGTGWTRYLTAIRMVGRPALIQAPYWKWVSWRLGEGAFKGKPADPATRPKDWEATVPASYWTRLKAFLAARKKPPSPPPPPYGTKESAGPFAGRGIMLGSNPDVWAQALELVKDGHCEVVAVTPSTPKETIKEFTGAGAEVVVWCPPEVHDAADVVQAESQTEWNAADHTAPGIVVNSWVYGKFYGRVALVEAYYNEGWGVDFGVYKNYSSQGAKAVIPVCGGYSASGRSDTESAVLYAHLAELPFPGFWMYAGESYLTDQSVAVLKASKSS